MNILAVIKLLNQIEADGVIGRYAIGGAVGATFYLEPISTLDVDVFVALHPAAGAVFVTLQPIYDYLKERGGVIEKEYVVVEGTPVQFLPPGSALVEEALRDAVTVDVEGTQARVFTAEHLAAIALALSRAKDKARVLQFIEEGALDADRFQLLLTRHDLGGKWQQFQRQFLDETP